MQLLVGPAWTQVQGASEQEESFLREYLSFEEPGAARARAVLWAKWQRGGRRGPPPRWDGRTTLYSAAKRRFPTGLLASVMREGRKRLLVFDVLDARRAPDPGSRAVAWLRDYQQVALAACLEKRAGVLKMGTGSGKTEVAVALTTVVPCRWLFLVSQLDLLAQTAERYRKRTGEEVGVVGEGEFRPARVTVAMAQSLYDKLAVPRVRELVRGAQGAIFDECHGLGSPRDFKVAMACENAVHRIGLSGTPFARGDGRNAFVMAATGPIIYELASAKLAEVGALTPLEVVMAPLRQRVRSGLSWQEKYDQAVVSSELRNRLLVAMAQRAQKPALLWVKQLAHGRELERLCREAGMRPLFVWGKWTAEEREQAIKRLRRGDVDVLVTNLFEQGTDIEEVRDVVVGTGGASAIKAVQRPGRAMRRSEGKEVARLWDIDDMGDVHLDRHAAARRAAYLKVRFRLRVLDETDVRLMLLKKPAPTATG